MRQLKISKQITNRESQSLDKYLQEIGKVDLLTPDEEVDLAKRIREGDQQALEKLTKANLRFVVSVAKQYQNQGLSLGDLINEGSELRRKWMDGIISQVDPVYLNTLQSYNKVLSQRNALLKNMAEHRLFDLESIEVWDAQMSKLGNFIHQKRSEFLNSRKEGVSQLMMLVFSALGFKT